MNGAPVPRLNPAKLLRSKWSACIPVNKEKHFMVVALIEPEAGAPIVSVTMEALHSGRQFELAWQDLRDTAVWRQGWL